MMPTQTGIVDEHIDAAMKCDGLFRKLMESVERRSDIKFKGVGALLLEICEFGEGASAGGRNDLVTTLQSLESHLSPKASANSAGVVLTKSIKMTRAERTKCR